MNRIPFEPCQISRVTVNTAVQCGNLTNDAVEFCEARGVFCEFGDRSLGITQIARPSGQGIVKAR